MIYLISIIIFFLLVLLALSIRRMPGKKKDLSLYISGLESIIDGKKEEAEKKLKDSFEKDSTNTGAYLHLGNLLREKGQINSAIKIHRNLSVNPVLKDSDIIRVKEALALDYLKSEQWEEALPLYEFLFNKQRSNDKIAKILLDLYEKLNKWDDAFKIAKKIYKNRKELANYATYIGSKLIDIDKKKAKTFLSIGQKNKISYAYYLLGNININAGSEKEGIEYLKKSISMDPDRAFLYIPILEDYMYKSGEFSVIEPYLKNLYNEYPDNWEILSSYISILKKKGDIDKAKKIMDEAIPNMSIDTIEKMVLVSAIYRDIDKDKACNYLNKLQKMINRNLKFRCNECLNENEEFNWKCPYCSSFGSLYRL